VLSGIARYGRVAHADPSKSDLVEHPVDLLALHHEAECCPMIAAAANVGFPSTLSYKR
jgi:hypothetical protein